VAHNLAMSTTPWCCRPRPTSGSPPMSWS
jgi:hypothetical protein